MAKDEKDTKPAAKQASGVKLKALKNIPAALLADEGGKRVYRGTTFTASEDVAKSLLRRKIAEKA